MQVGEVDGELLACLQLDLAPLTGERVGGVDLDNAADAVESLAVVGDTTGRLCDHIRNIAPGHFPVAVPFVERDIAFRIGQRSAVINFLGGPCVDRKRGGNAKESAAHGLYICEVAGDVFAGLVVDGIIGDRVVAFARVRAAAARAGFYGKILGSPLTRISEVRVRGWPS